MEYSVLTVESEGFIETNNTLPYAFQEPFNFEEDFFDYMSNIQPSDQPFASTPMNEETRDQLRPVGYSSIGQEAQTLVQTQGNAMRVQSNQLADIAPDPRWPATSLSTDIERNPANYDPLSFIENVNGSNTATATVDSRQQMGEDRFQFEQVQFSSINQHQSLQEQQAMAQRTARMQQHVIPEQHFRSNVMQGSENLGSQGSQVAMVQGQIPAMNYETRVSNVCNSQQSPITGSSIGSKFATLSVNSPQPLNYSKNFVAQQAQKRTAAAAGFNAQGAARKSVPIPFDSESLYPQSSSGGQFSHFTPSPVGMRPRVQPSSGSFCSNSTMSDDCTGMSKYLTGKIRNPEMAKNMTDKEYFLEVMADPEIRETISSNIWTILKYSLDMVQKTEEMDTWAYRMSLSKDKHHMLADINNDDMMFEASKKGVPLKWHDMTSINMMTVKRRKLDEEFYLKKLLEQKQTAEVKEKEKAVNAKPMENNMSENLDVSATTNQSEGTTMQPFTPLDKILARTESGSESSPVPPSVQTDDCRMPSAPTSVKSSEAEKTTDSESKQGDKEQTKEDNVTFDTSGATKGTGGDTSMDMSALTGSSLEKAKEKKQMDWSIHTNDDFDDSAALADAESNDEVQDANSTPVSSGFVTTSSNSSVPKTPPAKTTNDQNDGIISTIVTRSATKKQGTPEEKDKESFKEKTIQPTLKRSKRLAPFSKAEERIQNLSSVVKKKVKKGVVRVDYVPKVSNNLWKVQESSYQSFYSGYEFVSRGDDIKSEIPECKPTEEIILIYSSFPAKHRRLLDNFYRNSGSNFNKRETMQEKLHYEVTGKQGFAEKVQERVESSLRDDHQIAKMYLASTASKFSPTFTSQKVLKNCFEELDKITEKWRKIEMEGNYDLTDPKHSLTSFQVLTKRGLEIVLNSIGFDSKTIQMDAHMKMSEVERILNKALNQSPESTVAKRLRNYKDAAKLLYKSIPSRMWLWVESKAQVGAEFLFRLLEFWPLKPGIYDQFSQEETYEFLMLTKGAEETFYDDEDVREFFRTFHDSESLQPAVSPQKKKCKSNKKTGNDATETKLEDEPEKFKSGIRNKNQIMTGHVNLHINSLQKVYTRYLDDRCKEILLFFKEKMNSKTRLNSDRDVQPLSSMFPLPRDSDLHLQIREDEQNYMRVEGFEIPVALEFLTIMARPLLETSAVAEVLDKVPKTKAPLKRFFENPTAGHLERKYEEIPAGECLSCEKTNCPEGCLTFRLPFPVSKNWANVARKKLKFDSLKDPKKYFQSTDRQDKFEAFRFMNLFLKYEKCPHYQKNKMMTIAVGSTLAVLSETDKYCKKWSTSAEGPIRDRISTKELGLDSARPNTGFHLGTSGAFSQFVHVPLEVVIVKNTSTVVHETYTPPAGLHVAEINCEATRQLEHISEIVCGASGEIQGEIREVMRQQRGGTQKAIFAPFPQHPPEIRKALNMMVMKSKVQEIVKEVDPQLLLYSGSSASDVNAYKNCNPCACYIRQVYSAGEATVLIVWNLEELQAIGCPGHYIAHQVIELCSQPYLIWMMSDLYDNSPQFGQEEFDFLVKNIDDMRLSRIEDVYAKVFAVPDRLKPQLKRLNNPLARAHAVQQLASYFLPKQAELLKNIKQRFEVSSELHKWSIICSSNPRTGAWKFSDKNLLDEEKQTEYIQQNVFHFLHKVICEDRDRSPTLPIDRVIDTAWKKTLTELEKEKEKYVEQA